MENKKYTNEDLARDYLKVVNQLRNIPYDNYIAKKISELNINLLNFYNENEKSLNRLENEGIPNLSIGILELILEKGIKDAIRTVNNLSNFIKK